MKNFINKTLDFFKATDKGILIFLLIFAVIIAICFSETFSSILLITALIIFFIVVNKNTEKDNFMITPELSNAIADKANKLIFRIENYLNEHKKFLGIVDYDDFQGNIRQITNSCTYVEFTAKTKISGSPVVLEKLNEKSQDIEYIVSKGIFSLLQRYVYNIDVRQFVKIQIRYQQPDEKNCFCVIQIAFDNNFINNFIIR